LSIEIRRAGTADIPFIMATERGPGFDDLVGRWEEDRHRAEMKMPESRYLIGIRSGRPAGFALFQNLDDPFGNVLLKRIAVSKPGSGFGSQFLAAVLTAAFGLPGTYRVWLDVFLHNERARHVYRTVGFREDGVLREAYAKPDGTRLSLALMSILRPEWEARVETPRAC